MNNKLSVSFLVLDFNKPVESKLCLESIRKNAKFDYQLIYLSNGGEQEYVLDFYKQGLIDKLILFKKGEGCGNGTIAAFDSCDTDYAFYVQNDQELVREIDKQTVYYFENMLKSQKFHCIDLAGAQAGMNKYSERGQFIDVNFYKTIPKGIKGEYGGPGLYNDRRYVESYVQEYFEKNNLNVAHVYPHFRDNGKWSIREIGDGLYKHRCDTKQMYILRKPTYFTKEYPPFSEVEWIKVLRGEWVDGDIPETWKKHSFKYWED